MKYGKTKTGKVHIFTDMNECICDLNIPIFKEVSKEYAQRNLCKNCEALKND